MNTCGHTWVCLCACVRRCTCAYVVQGGNARRQTASRLRRTLFRNGVHAPDPPGYFLADRTGLPARPCVPSTASNVMYICANRGVTPPATVIKIEPGRPKLSDVSFYIPLILGLLKNLITRKWCSSQEIFRGILYRTYGQMR